MTEQLTLERVDPMHTWECTFCTFYNAFENDPYTDNEKTLCKMCNNPRDDSFKPSEQPRRKFHFGQMVRVLSMDKRGELLYYDSQNSVWIVALAGEGGRTVNCTSGNLVHATSVDFDLLLASGGDELETLLAKGADQSELLIQAVETGSENLVKRLIANKCDVNIHDSRSGQTLINLAVRENHTEVLKALLDADVVIGSALEVACRRRDVLVIELLLEHNSLDIGPLYSTGMLSHAINAQEMSILWHCLSHTRDQAALQKALNSQDWDAYLRFMDSVSEMYYAVWLDMKLRLGKGECAGWLSHTSFHHETKGAFEEFLAWRREIATLIVTGVRCIE